MGKHAECFVLQKIKKMIAILDTNIGNLRSVHNAINSLGFKNKIITHLDINDDYSHLIIPGVGAFPYAMQQKDSANIKEKINNFASSRRPILGICLGMQLMSDFGEEGKGAKGFGLIAGKVIKIPNQQNLILPHVGWNTVNFKKEHPIFKGIKNRLDYYFVHSYHFKTDNEEHVLGTSHYGRDFASIVGKDNLVGFQFHPEKSQKSGLKLLENFCNWDGAC